MKYFSALKGKKILIYATMWMNLENIISETSLSQNVRYYDSTYVRYLE